jgi:hypothetical protein
MIFNQYKHTTLPKALARDMAFLCRFVYLYIRNGFRTKTILFYPDMPYRKAAIYRMMMLTNFNITNNPRRKFDLAINWQDVTKRTHDQFIKNLSQKTRVVNFHCTDISKEKVEDIFAEVFGYASFVDPLVFEGECVEKSDINGKHDARIVQCPIIARKPGYIYQKLIHSSDKEGFVMNYRVPVFGRTIPFLTRRYKPETDRFDNTESAVLVNLADEFTAEEVDKILEFCRRLGMEYGELDIMRDQADGRLYILDANNTPTVARLDNTIRISAKDRKFIHESSVRAFVNNFMQTDRKKKALAGKPDHSYTGEASPSQTSAGAAKKAI